MEKEIRRGVETVSAGTYEILTPVEELRDQLLRIEKIGRICYQSKRKPITQESAAEFISMHIKRGRERVIEHSSLTVLFHNCSRGFTHELVRHKLASFSQELTESTRDVDYSKNKEVPDLDTLKLTRIIPLLRDPNEIFSLESGGQISALNMLSQIRGLRKSSWFSEDARQILPTSIKVDIGMTANFREWRRVFEMMTQKTARWEIRGVMLKLLEEIKEIVPPVFVDFIEGGTDKNGLRYFIRQQ